MVWKPSRVHLLGVIATIVVAVLLQFTLIPYLARLVFPPPYRGFAAPRTEALYYLTLALIPVVLWLVPPVLRALAHGTYRTHRLVMGKSGFYLRFPLKRTLRFRDTFVMSLGPFAIDLLVIAELTYFFNTPDVRLLGRGLVAIPSLLVLAAIITALIPGPWLVDALDIRLVTPSRGEVVRAAELFERILGPVSAVALLVSFITTLHLVDYSYEQGLVSLAELAIRLFPPIVTAVSVYRVFLEPDVLPSLERWCDLEGIREKPSLPEALSRLESRTTLSTASEAEPLPDPKSEGPGK